jgi:hypothetical protein
MFGSVTQYDAATKRGELVGPNNLAYCFVSELPWCVGQKVAFDWYSLPHVDGRLARGAMNLRETA